MTADVSWLNGHRMYEVVKMKLPVGYQRTKTDENHA